MPVLAFGTPVHQKLAAQPAPVVCGVVVSEHFTGKHRNQCLVVDVAGIRSDGNAGVQLMPSVSLIPFSRKKFRLLVSPRPSTLA